jgi:CubicO group peptidase (beta-lactamase class C family)
MSGIKSFCWIVASALCPGASASKQPGDLSDVKAMEAFIDGVMHLSMRSNHVAGSVVSILINGEVILARGYGYSDVENQIAVDHHVPYWICDKAVYLYGAHAII